MKELAIDGDAARLVALEECEQKILSAYRRGLEATCDMAKQFRRIQQYELYKERGCGSFEEYAVKHLRADLRSVNRTLEVAEVIEVLRRANLPMPANETQAAELSRLGADHQAEVWQRLLKAEEVHELPLTAAAVKKAVDLAREIIEAQAERQDVLSPKGVQTALDMESADGAGTPKKMTAIDSQPKVPERAVRYDESGEAALERISRLCGAAVGKAIESGNLPMTQRELIKWAEEGDEMVERLAHYVNDLRWKVDKAIQFEMAGLDEATTLTKVREMALARGGRMSFTLADIKVVVEHLATAAA
jgi:hypothetical protein